MSKQHFPPRPLAPASAPARHHRKSLGPLEQWRMWYPESVGCSGHPEFQGKSIMWLSNIYVILWVTIYLPYREREPLAFNSIMCRFSMVFTGDGLPLVEMTAWDIYIYTSKWCHISGYAKYQLSPGHPCPWFPPFGSHPISWAWPPSHLRQKNLRHHCCISRDCTGDDVKQEGFVSFKVYKQLYKSTCFDPILLKINISQFTSGECGSCWTYNM